MIYGYIRVSTRAQLEGNSIEAQKISIDREAKIDRYFIDGYTGTKMVRPQWSEMLNEIKRGDTLVVDKMDRFARTISEATDILNRFLDDDIAVIIANLKLRLDSSPTNMLVRNMLLTFSQFERDMIIERTQEGRALARLQTGYKEGRPPKFKKQQIEFALELLDSGYSYNKVALLTGISKTTLWRWRKK